MPLVISRLYISILSFYHIFENFSWREEISNFRYGHWFNFLNTWALMISPRCFFLGFTIPNKDQDSNSRPSIDRNSTTSRFRSITTATLSHARSMKGCLQNKGFLNLCWKPVNEFFVSRLMKSQLIDHWLLFFRFFHFFAISTLTCNVW